MARRKYDEVERGRLLGVMAATAVIDNDRIKPQWTTVSKAEGVPIGTLRWMWRAQGPATIDSLRQRLTREREEVSVSAGREWLDTTIANIAANLPYITSRERFTPVLWLDPEGRPALNTAGCPVVLTPALRADQAARAYKDAYGLAVEMGQRLGLLDKTDPEADAPDLATAEGRDRMADMLAALPPELLTEARRRQECQT